MTDAPRWRPDPDADERHYLPEDYPWTRYAVNDSFPQVRVKWERNLHCDVGSGAAIRGDKVAVADEQGVVHMLNAFSGKELWTYATGGKIFSTPALGYDRLVVGSTDGFIYCLRIRDGSLIWRYACGKAVVASPVIRNGRVYCGASDGAFRALDLSSGGLIWKYGFVEGFVECRPYVDDAQVVFGDWANTLYSLDPATGELQWTWKSEGTRLFSPAAVHPVKTAGRLYLVTPHRKSVCLDAATGKELWTALAGGYGAASDRMLLTCAAYAPMLILCGVISFCPAPKRSPVFLRRFAAPVLMILCLAALAAQGYAPFVYFQF